MSIEQGADVAWLQQEFQRSCDGQWEQDHGISIRSTDNPGWWVRFHLKDYVGPDVHIRTEGIPPSDATNNLTVGPWFTCRIVDGWFDGTGDVTRLSELIAELRRSVAALKDDDS